MRIAGAPRADAATLLTRAIVADAAAAGLIVRVVTWRCHAWASVTFTGWRHEAMLSLPPGPAAETWLAALPDRELNLRGHLLAELTVTRAPGGAIDLAALTIEAN